MAGLRTYLSTIKYLKSSQIRARIARFMKKRSKKDAMPPNIVRQLRYPPRLYMEVLDDDPTVTDRFCISKLPDGDVYLLNETKKVDFTDMTPEGEYTPLWRFNLLYLEYLIPLANQYVLEDRLANRKAIREIIIGARVSFEKNQEERWPYILALQTTNILIARDILSRATSFFSKKEEDDFLIDLYRKYGYLQKHREKELLANHYFENIKALLILAMAFGDEKKVERYLSELKGELKEQILPDGMHYERSFMYHKLILEDLIRIVLASRQTPWESQVYGIVGPYIIAMCNILMRLEGNLPRTLFFNDAADNVAKPTRSLLKAAELLGFIDVKALESGIKSHGENCFITTDSGFFRMDREKFSLVVDTGKISPDYNPGHAHNCFMSYELMTKNMPIIVNSGVGCYQGPERAYYRSVAAHNTFMIDGVEPSECWAEHRVGRRIEDVKVTFEDDKLTGEFKDQQGRRGRRIILLKDDFIKIFDEALGGDKAEITSFIHLDPDFFIVRKSENLYAVSHSFIRHEFEILVTEGKGTILSKDENRPYSSGFGKKEYIDILMIKGSRVSYVIRPVNYGVNNLRNEKK